MKKYFIVEIGNEDEQSKLNELRHVKLSEVENIAKNVIEQVNEQCPINDFSHISDIKLSASDDEIELTGDVICRGCCVDNVFESLPLGVLFTNDAIQNEIKRRCEVEERLRKAAEQRDQEKEQREKQQRHNQFLKLKEEFEK